MNLRLFFFNALEEDIPPPADKKIKQNLCGSIPADLAAVKSGFSYRDLFLGQC